ncbi:hypothetical protein BpHYR1_043935 [Brachionus plicatilis]|uniref:Uncharacterized protein n=1 Tax=Brachionus plicatilis TaxID=10195 RepID=A0A3M7RJT8_BRAPC|nr:hypothetical protein BpHYR1_043935 [Brachionus plicatilis]
MALAPGRASVEPRWHKIDFSEHKIFLLIKKIFSFILGLINGRFGHYMDMRPMITFYCKHLITKSTFTHFLFYHIIIIKSYHREGYLLRFFVLPFYIFKEFIKNGLKSAII